MSRNLILDLICVKHYFTSVENPWVSWFAGEYLNKTRHLTMSQHGAYSLLLWEYYISGPIPAREQQVLNICLAHAEHEKADVAFVLSEFFTVENGFYHNARADEEISKRQDIRNKRVEAGKARHKPATKSSAHAEHMHTQSQSHINTKPTPPIIPPSPPGGNGKLTVRDRRRLNDEIWRLMEAHPEMPLEEAMETACAEMLISIESARAAISEAGMEDALRRKKR
jgi:uncharacterized protein YdaU (DUF1376 family)